MVDWFLYIISTSTRIHELFSSYCSDYPPSGFVVLVAVDGGRLVDIIFVWGVAIIEGLIVVTGVGVGVVVVVVVDGWGNKEPPGVEVVPGFTAVELNSNDGLIVVGVPLVVVDDNEAEGVDEVIGVDVLIGVVGVVPGGGRKVSGLWVVIGVAVVGVRTWWWICCCCCCCWWCCCCCWCDGCCWEYCCTVLSPVGG